MPILSTAITALDGLTNLATSRLEIRAYSNKERTNRVMGRGFVAPINPASLKIQYANKLSGQSGLNSAGPKLTLSGNEAENISFKLILTDSSAFHYTGRNIFTFKNDYEVDGKEVPVSPIAELIGSNVDIGLGEKFGVSRDGHVAQAIERFLNLTTQKPAKKVANDAPVGNFDQPVFLGLIWGRIFTRPGKMVTAEGPNKGNFVATRQKIYPCYLASVDINYTHFTRDGRVLRAELECKFKEDSEG